MLKAVLDIETTFTLINGKTNPSPYIDTNKLVSVGFLFFNDSGVVGTDYYIVNHIEVSRDCQVESFKKIQESLDKCELIIAHNGKFDMSWLLTCGLVYDRALWDTMICEYVFCKGLKQPINLAASCARYGLQAKSDILGDYRDKGINTDAVPLQELISYGENDIEITYQLYQKQQELIRTSEDHKYMSKATNLMNQTLPVIIEMERNGIHIDLTELDRVEKQYREEYNLINATLSELVVKYMGHTPVNLDSPEHLSCVLYSRKVKDKVLWKETFNLGTEVRNSVVKMKYSTRMSSNDFIKVVREQTELLRKTEAKQCEVCNGAGRIRKTKKDGTDFKKQTLCKACRGQGFNYIPVRSYAGFRLSPLGTEYTSIGGFSTDKLTLLELLKDETISEDCRSFLSGLLRMNAISTYLSTFVEGIRKNVRNNILHSSFNMCSTATGRLSSSGPNFQNLPRAKTFPIRKVVTPHWNNGKILSVDFEKFEFTVAAILSGDEVARQEILDGIDIHIFTMNTLNTAGMNIDRQDAKSRTFGPLYGKTKGNLAEETYFKAFKDKYKGIAAWHERLENEALNTKQIKSPSGRIFSFPTTRRLSSGIVTNSTQIKNYPVQSFATGDITPIALIEVTKEMIKQKVQSKLILTVHDDLTFSIYAGEEELMVSIIRKVFNNMNNYVNEYFGINTDIPITGEISMGLDWLSKEKLSA